jgi:hypothetical protein
MQDRNVEGIFSNIVIRHGNDPDFPAMNYCFTTTAFVDLVAVMYESNQPFDAQSAAVPGTGNGELCISLNKYITLHYITYSTQQGVGTPLGAKYKCPTWVCTVKYKVVSLSCAQPAARQSSIQGGCMAACTACMVKKQMHAVLAFAVQDPGCSDC